MAGDHSNLNNHPTIGVLTPVLWSIHGTQWEGMSQAGRAHKANLIHFVGREINKPGTPNYSANIIYRFVDKKIIDGLIIVTGALGAAIPEEEQIAFCRSFLPLPVVSIEIPVQGIKSLHIDDSGGIQAAVEHMIKKHKLSKIGFVRGPEFSHVAQARCKAYRDTLKKNGLSVNEDFVVPNPGLWEFSVDYYIDYLSKRQSSLQDGIEAFICASDGMALRMIEALQSLGLRVPGDVAVTGFDDAVESRAAMPAITTIRQPHFDLGRIAMELVLSQLENKTVREQTFITPELVLRQSCGCESQTIAKISSSGAHKVIVAGFVSREQFETAYKAQRDVIAAGMTDLLDQLKNQVWERAKFAEMADTYVGAILENQGDAFLPAARGIFRTILTAGGEPTLCHDVLSLLHKAILMILRDPELVLQAEILMQRARVAVGETTAQENARHDYNRDQSGLELFSISQDLVTAFDVSILIDRIVQKLPNLGIVSCYIALYQDPQDVSKGSRLVLAYDERGRRDVGPGGRVVPDGTLLPSDFLATQRQFELLALPLFFNEDQLGYVLFEPTRYDGALHEMLRIQISSALKGAMLLKTVNQQSGEMTKANTELQDAYKSLHENQKILEEHARKTEELVMPMIETIRKISALAAAHNADVTRLKESSVENEKRAQNTERIALGIAEMLGKTHRITETISDISERVNLISLNASIEAAHAGTYGRGFSVIASEIRKLSESTRQNISTITEFLNGTDKGLEEFVVANKQFHTAYMELHESVGKVTNFLQTLMDRLGGMEVSSRSILDVMMKK